MFTGLIEELGTVKSLQRAQTAFQLTVAADTVLKDVKIGDSIAVNGTCLTVVACGKSEFTADVMPETVRRTVLSALKPGDTVNLERTMALGDRFGGHIVSGHIDGVGEILQKKQDENAVVVKISAAKPLLRYVIEKGSVAIDGISLTVVACGKTWFSVSLIPHTASATTLGWKKEGDAVNIETDMIGKYVERLLTYSPEENKSSAITMEFLQKNGF